MSAKLTLGLRRAAISLTRGAMLPASLRTGTTMETAGGAPAVDVSLIFSPFGSRVRVGELYGATSARATLLSREKEGPGNATMAPASTSLGKWAVSTTRLTAMAAA